MAITSANLVPPVAGTGREQHIFQPENAFNNTRQTRFILGQELNNPVNVNTSPVRFRFSSSFRPTTRNSPTKFHQIRNRNYVLASPQQQRSTLRAKKSGSISKRGSSHQVLSAKLSSESTGEGESMLVPRSKSVKISRKRDSKTLRKQSSGEDRTSFNIKQSAIAKWAPISEEAKSILLDSMAYSAHLIGVSGTLKKGIEQQLKVVTDKVKQELAMATAPRKKRLKSYSKIKHDTESLKLKYSDLASGIDDLDQTLNNFKSQAEDMQEKTRSMSDACRETMYTSTCSEEDVQSKKVWTSKGEDVFCDYLTDILESNRCASKSVLYQWL